MTPTENDRAREIIEGRFVYHPPGENQRKRMTLLRSKFRDVALEIARLTPESREQSLALTKLEEAMMHANSAIARNEERN